MALNVPLSQLIEAVQLETGLSANPALGQNFRAHIAHAIHMEQKRLYEEFDWPHMIGTLANGFFDKETAVGQRYYDYPTDIAYQNVRKAFVRWGNVWLPLVRGIHTELFTSYNSDEGARADPPMRWSPHTADQFEIWPIPASVTTIRFTGKRKLRALVLDTDVCDLDDTLLVLMAGAKIMSRRDPKAAGAMRADAERYKMVLRSQQMSDTVIRLGDEPKELDPRDPTQRIITAKTG